MSAHFVEKVTPVLPIESLFSAISASLSQTNQIILQAPTGAGKSTALPLYLLQKKAQISGKIILLEPRRLAAKNIAYYLAEQLGEAVGESVGYRMRGDTQVSNQTHLEIVTEGVLTRMLQADPELNGVGLIIFDEFHERNLHADLGLALCLDVQGALRDDLKLMVMSATLDNLALQKVMPEADVLSCEGRMFAVEVDYCGAIQTRYLIDALAEQVKQAVTNDTGNILVFLPGKKEILQLSQRLGQQGWRDVQICPLYGGLSLAAQRKAIAAPADNERKVVLATNIAETSLTIAGIRIVIDSMRERRVKLDGRTGATRLVTRLISQASAMQRMGRAGRVQAGRCYRLINQEGYSGLESHSQPQINEVDLTDLVLELAGWGIQDPAQLTWVTSPPVVNWRMALSLLQGFDALDTKGKLTPHGQAMLAFATDARSAHMLLKAKWLEHKHGLTGVAALAAKLMVVLSSPATVSESGAAQQGDLSYQLEHPLNKEGNQLYRQAIHKLGVQAPKVLPVEYTGLIIALAYPDRIAIKRQQGERWLLACGVGMQLYAEHVLNRHHMLAVADIGGQSQHEDVTAFNGAPLTLEHVERYLPHLIQHREKVFWDAASQKVKGVEQVCLGSIVLSSQPMSNMDPSLRSQALIEGILSLPSLPLSNAAKDYIALAEYARGLMPELALPDLSLQGLRTSVSQWLAPYLLACTRIDDVAKLDTLMLVKQILSWEQQQALAEHFPKYYHPPVGRKVKIHYHGDHAPYIEVKLQHMFGVTQTPTIANGRVPIMIVLLSPAARPLQMTRDLAGFWQGSYQDIKKEMKGRYPKHHWELPT
ncbi:ATP-dependent helicase HrpB [Motilimonas eburnea]|uniref:ATP-dependent helicase HrpB n=1 Tax=Motilimonas eburnea TaxID=1737488 RepID=UPI001E58627D|nr:ATP-dependent helicase HrpB [Motilimonas eburnea]MCE2570982.1 ATP-dependent helicase HrpB [Motilimonas eburnea]